MYSHGKVELYFGKSGVGMKIRLLRVFATVLITALVVFLLSGCGGEEETKTSAKKAKATKTSATAGLDAPESLVGQVIVPTEQSPEDFRQALEDRRPVVVFFYMPEPADDSRVRTSIMTLQSRFRGQVEFLDYLYSDAEDYGDLVQLLKVNSTPTVVVINYQAQVQRAWTGFVDEDSIEQGIVEALNASGSASGSTTGSSYSQGTSTGTATTSTSPGSSSPGSPSQVP